MSLPYSRTISSSTTLSPFDFQILVNITDAPITILLAKVSTIASSFASSGININLFSVKFSDINNLSATHNIVFASQDGDTINGQTTLTINVNGSCGCFYLMDDNRWGYANLSSDFGGTGTVTSVGLSLPNILTVSNSPVTSSGTITAVLASQLQNLVFASPNGTAGSPTFRQLLVADISGLQNESIQTLVDGATVTWDVSLGSTALLNISGSRTLVVSNVVAGRYYAIKVKNVSGSSSLALPAASLVVNGGAGVISLTATVNAVDWLSFVFDGVNYNWSYGSNFT